jgi:tetratricopeptide (TPR) repeat protein
MMSTDPMRARQAGTAAVAAVLLVSLSILARPAEGAQEAPQISTSGAGGTPVPAARPASRTIELDDPALREVLDAARTAPGCQTYADVANRYAELNLRDQAARFFTDGLALDPRCSTAHDGLAKLWRDTGAMGLALASAHRATYFEPRSAAYWNTYGTILQALGQVSDAEAAYRRVLSLDGSAAYAHSNLCYLATLAGDADRATAACKAALAVDPGYVPALNNLGLLHAASGDASGAFALFSSARGPAAAHYNMGVVNLSRRDYAAAIKAFESAYREDPSFDDAHEWARRARRLLQQQSEKTRGDDRRR